MKTSSINVPEIKLKLIERLKPSGWASKLKGFIYSKDFDAILDTLVELRDSGERFTPPLKDLFTAFEECPVDQLKIILMAADPYTALNIADGMALSCSKSIKAHPSLEEVLKAIKKTVYRGDTCDESHDLRRWANQGVLLLNTALTTQVDMPGNHYKIWQPFVSYLVDILNNSESQYIWIFMGKEAQTWAHQIDDDDYVDKVPYPVWCFGSRPWDSAEVFNRVNDTLSRNGKSKIIW